MTLLTAKLFMSESNQSFISLLAKKQQALPQCHLKVIQIYFLKVINFFNALKDSINHSLFNHLAMFYAYLNFSLCNSAKIFFLLFNDSYNINFYEMCMNANFQRGD